MQSQQPRRVEVRVHVPLIRIQMRFPCKLQLGVRMNSEETISQEVVELKDSQATFDHSLLLTVNVPNAHNPSPITEQPRIRRQWMEMQLIIYAVYAKRRIAIGFIGVDLKDLLCVETKCLQLERKIERCPDKSALAQLKITMSTNNISVQNQIENKEGECVTQIATMPEMGREYPGQAIKKTISTEAPTKRVVKQIPFLKLLSDPLISDRYLKDKFLRVPSPKAIDSILDQDLDLGNQETREDFLQKSSKSKFTDSDALESESPVNRKKALSNINFLGSEEEYIKWLKIQVTPEIDFANFNQSVNSGVETDRHSRNSESRMIFDMQSFRESAVQVPQPKEVHMLQKRLSLNEHYFKAELEKYSRKLLETEQQKQALAVELSLKDDQVKELQQQLELHRTRHPMKYEHDGFNADRIGEEKSYINSKMHHLVGHLEERISDLVSQLQNARRESYSQKISRVNLQESVNGYYMRSENDRETIDVLNGEIDQLNNTIRDLIGDTSIDKRTAPDNTSRRRMAELMDSNIDELESHVDDIQKEITEKENEINKSRETNRQLEKRVEELTQQVGGLEKSKVEWQTFAEEKSKYLSDIQCLVRRMRELEKITNNLECSVIPGMDDQIKGLYQQLETLNEALKAKEEKLQSTKISYEKTIQELRVHENYHRMDEENIREFERELTEKYRVIYNLETSLRQEKSKSRSMSRSIEGELCGVTTKGLEFSFSNHCSHNFGPLCSAIKEISKSVQRHKFDVINKMSIDDPQQQEVLLIKQHGLLEEILKRLLGLLEEAERSPEALSSAVKP